MDDDGACCSTAANDILFFLPLCVLVGLSIADYTNALLVEADGLWALGFTTAASAFGFVVRWFGL